MQTSKISREKMRLSIAFIQIFNNYLILIFKILNQLKE